MVAELRGNLHWRGRGAGLHGFKLIVSRENIGLQDCALLHRIGEVGDDLIADDLSGSFCQHGKECGNVFLVINAERTKGITQRVSIRSEHAQAIDREPSHRVQGVGDMKRLYSIGLEPAQESTMQEHGKFRASPTDVATSLARNCLRTRYFAME